MVWVDSPKFFYAFSKTLVDVANTLIHMSVSVPGCGAIAKIPETGIVPPHTLYFYTHI